MNISSQSRSFCLFVLCIVAGVFQCAAQTPKELFERFENGDFFALKSSNGVIVMSGWEMDSEDGKTYHRAVLNRQVEELVKQGRKSVPVALRRLEHQHMHIRYIAAESLRRITKQDPIWYNFGTPGQPFNGNKTWSSDAITEWSGWYAATKNRKAQQDGADQPATAPKSKSEGKTNPKPETEERSQ